MNMRTRSWQCIGMLRKSTVTNGRAISGPSYCLHRRTLGLNALPWWCGSRRWKGRLRLIRRQLGHSCRGHEQWKNHRKTVQQGWVICSLCWENQIQRQSVIYEIQLYIIVLSDLHHLACLFFNESFACMSLLYFFANSETMVGCVCARARAHVFSRSVVNNFLWPHGL